jgi:superfamily II DNA or RNA helicase
LDKRTQIQHEASNEWLSHKRGICVLRTGSGKMRLLAMCLLKAIRDGLISDKDKVMFMAEVSLNLKSRRRQDFLKDLAVVEGMLGIKNTCEIIFQTYQANKSISDEVKLLLLDEVDVPSTVLIKPLLEYKNYLVGVTATLKETGEVSKKELVEQLAPVIYRYGFNQALEDGIANKVNLYRIPHELGSNSVNIWGSKWGTEKEYWEFWNNKAKEIAFSNPTWSLSIKKNKLPRFLFNLESKIPLVRRFLSVAKKKTIGFGKELLYLEKISRNVVTEKTYIDLLAKLERGEITHVLSSKKIQRGENIPSIVNILLIGVGKDSDMIEQLAGRSRFEEGKETNVFVVVTKGTYEERWFEEIIKKRDKNGKVKSTLNWEFKGDLKL